MQKSVFPYICAHLPRCDTAGHALKPSSPPTNQMLIDTKMKGSGCENRVLIWIRRGHLAGLHHSNVDPAWTPSAHQSRSATPLFGKQGKENVTKGSCIEIRTGNCLTGSDWIICLFRFAAVFCTKQLYSTLKNYTLCNGLVFNFFLSPLIPLTLLPVFHFFLHVISSF